jgi:hypothetical protein
VIFAGVGVLLLVCILPNAFARDVFIPTSHRRLKMFERAKTLSSTSLNG